MRLIFDRPANARLDLDGTVYHGGEEIECDEQTAQRLLSGPYGVRDADAAPQPAAPDISGPPVPVRNWQVEDDVALPVAPDSAGQDAESEPDE